MCVERKEKKKINQSEIEEKQNKIEKKEKGSLNQTMSEQCAELLKEKKEKMYM